jgi:hypothetical protein
MRVIVRRDLHDEDSNNYRWTDNEVDRHIAQAVKAFSDRLPLEQKAALATANGSRELDIAALTGRVMVEVVEYPAGRFPPVYQPFTLWGDTLTLLGDEVPDGSYANIYYGQLHTLDTSTSTIPAQYEDLIAAGAGGYAAEAWAVYAINKVNPGGNAAPQELLAWANQKNRVRVKTLYQPFYPIVSQQTDHGP